MFDKFLFKNIITLTFRKGKMDQNLIDSILKRFKYCCHPALPRKTNHIKMILDLALYKNQIGTSTIAILPNISLVFQIIESNLFRPRKCKKVWQRKQQCIVDQINDDDLITANPHWPELQQFYEFLLNFLVAEEVTTRQLKRFISVSFIQQLISLFDSEDSMEREYIRFILVRLYAKVVPLRKLIRKEVQNVFRAVVCSNLEFNGVKELLQFYFGFISGFSVPLREQHLEFVRNGLLPLYKVQNSEAFLTRLVQCLRRFIEKDRSLIKETVQFLIKYWPNGNYKKEILFIQSLDLLQESNITELPSLVQRLLKRLAKCLQSGHTQVSAKVLNLFQKQYIMPILKAYRAQIIMLFTPIVYRLTQNHWETQFRKQLTVFQGRLRDIDPQFFDTILAKQKSGNRRESVRPMVQLANSLKWRDFLSEAKRINPLLLTLDDSYKDY